MGRLIISTNYGSAAGVRTRIGKSRLFGITPRSIRLVAGRRILIWLLASRERRLWLGVLAVLTAIYLSLGFAPALAGELRERGLLTIAFGLGMLLTAATIAAPGLKARPRGAAAAVALGVATAFLLMFTRLASPEERTHLIEYGILGALLHEALAERAAQGRRAPMPPLTAALAAATLGVIDEGLQALLPNRVFDPRDILFNALAGAAAVAAGATLSRLQRRRGRPKTT